MKANTPPPQRFAYLIIAHGEPYILERLVNIIDDPRNDIYILFDKKSDLSLFKDISVCYSKLTFCEPVDIRWGDISQIVAELSLFESAYEGGRYEYFHLISGVDLPIKSQDYIHAYFQRPENKGKEFIHYVNTVGNMRDLKYKTQYYHWFTRFYRKRSLVSKAIVISIIRLSIILQKLFKINREYPFELKKGMNWCSLSCPGVEFLLSKKQELLKIFRNTLCPDEIFIQTLFWNYWNRELIHTDSIRLIDWERGRPYTFSNSDYTELVNSEMLFARKFSTSSSAFKEIVDIIYNLLKHSVNEHR